MVLGFTFVVLGFGFLVTAIVTTILILLLKEDVAFGVGWGLPYVWAGVYMIGTIVFVKRSLKICYFYVR